MLKELNKVKGEPSTINVINKNGEVSLYIYIYMKTNPFSRILFKNELENILCCLARMKNI